MYVDLIDLVWTTNAVVDALLRKGVYVDMVFEVVVTAAAAAAAAVFAAICTWFANNDARDSILSVRVSKRDYRLTGEVMNRDVLA